MFFAVDEAVVLTTWISCGKLGVPNKMEPKNEVTIAYKNSIKGHVVKLLENSLPHYTLISVTQVSNKVYVYALRASSKTAIQHRLT